MLEQSRIGAQVVEDNTNLKRGARRKVGAKKAERNDGGVPKVRQSSAHLDNSKLWRQRRRTRPQRDLLMRR